MRTKEEMEAYARGLAETHFYSDDDTPWEPFEHWDEADIEEEIDNLAVAVYRAMIWAQEGAQL